MAAVTICSDFGAPQNKVWHCFHCFPIYFPWSDRTGCHEFVFWMLSFKPTFSLSSFTFIKRLFSVLEMQVPVFNLLSFLLSGFWMCWLELLQPLCFIRILKTYVGKDERSQAPFGSWRHNSSPMLSTRWHLHDRYTCWNHCSFFVRLASVIVLSFILGVHCHVRLKELSDDDGPVQGWLKVLELPSPN